MAYPAYIDQTTGVLTDGEAWVPLAKAEPNSATVTFTNGTAGTDKDWSQYVDLVILGHGRSSVSGSSGQQLTFRINGDSDDLYVWQELHCVGNTVSAGGNYGTSSARWGYAPQNSSTANFFSAHKIDFVDVNSGKWKTWHSQSSCSMNVSNAGGVTFFSGVYQHHDPITSINIMASFLDGSRFDLFGVLPRMVQ